MDDQKVVHVTHLVNHAELVVQPVDVSLRRIVAELLTQPVKALVLEIDEVIHMVRHFEMRQNRVAEREIHVAPIGNDLRVVDRFGQIGEQRAHLVFGLHVEFVR